MPDFLRDDSEREAVLGMVHESRILCWVYAYLSPCAPRLLPSASMLARENEALKACPPPMS